MIKINYQCSNVLLKDLLEQYYNEVEFDENADIKISENSSAFTLSKASDKEITFSKPASINKIISALEEIKQECNINEVIKIGPIDFIPRHKICVLKNQEIVLTPKETDLLLYLSAFPDGKSRSEILKNVWGYSREIETNTLESHIYKLRTKFYDGYEIILLDGEKYKLNFNS